MPTASRNVSALESDFDLSSYVEPHALEAHLPVKPLCLVYHLHSDFIPYRRFDEVWRQANPEGKPGYRNCQTKHQLILTYPRGVPWTEYPLWSAPYFKGKPWKPCNEGMDSGFAAVPRDEEGTAQNATDSYTAGWMISRMMEPNDLRPVWIITEADTRRTNPDDLMHPASAEMAFRYSYKVNSLAIAARAVHAALEVLVPDEYIGRLTIRRNHGDGTIISPWVGTCREDEQVRHICDPYTIQFLYALRKAGRCSLGVATPWTKEYEGSLRCRNIQLHDSCLASSIKGLPVVTRGVDNSYPLWVGSGRHAPAALGPRFDLEVSLLGAWLIDVDDAGTLGVTARGERLLDLLHPDCEDPDVLCRWRTPSRHPGDPQTYIAAEHMEAVKAWTLRHFRKMKASINAKLGG